MNRALFVFVCTAAAGCGSSVDGHSPGATDAGTISQPTSDAGPSYTLQADPSSVAVSVGATATIEVSQIDQRSGAEIETTYSWTSDEVRIAAVEDGVVTGIGEGATQIRATSGEGATIAVAVTVTDPVDIYSCCLEEVDNFCDLPMPTTGCPMTEPGGYCNPDGDGDTTQLEDDAWVRGYKEFRQLCKLTVDYEECCRDDIDENFCNLPANTDGCPMTAAGGYCNPVEGEADDDRGEGEFEARCGEYLEDEWPDALCRQGWGDHNEPCDDAFSPYPDESWRCVFSYYWTGLEGTDVPVSQVCRDVTNDGVDNPTWQTFHLYPSDCCQCEDIPGSIGCCQGGNCF